MKQVQHNSGPSLLIAIPTLGRPVPLEWAMAFKSLTPPINFNVNFSIVIGQEIGNARQALAEQAVSSGCRYLFFLGDDVVVPGHALRQLIYRMEQDPTIDVVGGVYCAKADPAAPLVFRGNGAGTYWDWKIGEFFPVTGMGMDCTLIRCSAFAKITKPWFKTVDIDRHIDGIASAESWTEDLYFFDKLEKANGVAYCDGSVICDHWDVYNRKVWKLPTDSLPMRQRLVDTKKRYKSLVIGPTILLGDDYDITHCLVDGDSCDFRVSYGDLPFESDQFDFTVITDRIINFERFLPEWKRVTKSDGKLAINLHPFLEPATVASFYGGSIDGSFLEVTTGNGISH